MQRHIGEPNVVERIDGQPVRHIETIGSIFLQDCASFLVQNQMCRFLDGAFAGQTESIGVFIERAENADFIRARDPKWLYKNRKLAHKK